MKRILVFLTITSLSYYNLSSQNNISERNDYISIGTNCNTFDLVGFHFQISNINKKQLWQLSYVHSGELYFDGFKPTTPNTISNIKSLSLKHGRIINIKNYFRVIPKIGPSLNKEEFRVGFVKTQQKTWNNTYLEELVYETNYNLGVMLEIENQLYAKHISFSLSPYLNLYNIKRIEFGLKTTLNLGNLRPSKRISSEN